MTRTVDFDDLVPRALIAARLGIASLSTVSHWIYNSGFPPAVGRIYRLSVWLWQDVRPWAIAEGWVPYEQAKQLPTSPRRLLIDPDDGVPVGLGMQRLGLDDDVISDAQLSSHDVVAWRELEDLRGQQARRRG